MEEKKAIREKRERVNERIRERGQEVIKRQIGEKVVVMGGRAGETGECGRRREERK